MRQNNDENFCLVNALRAQCINQSEVLNLKFVSHTVMTNNHANVTNLNISIPLSIQNISKLARFRDVSAM